MRRVLGLLAAIGLVAAILPGTVAAAKPINLTASQSGIRCDLVSEVGAVSVYVEASADGGFADLAIWSPDLDPMVDLPDIFTSFSSVTVDGSTLVASFELVYVVESPDPEGEPTFEPAGTASIRATVTPDGDLMDWSGDDVRDGNRLVRRGFFTQVLAVEGELAIDMLEGTSDAIGLSDCDGGLILQTMFVTNPNAYVVGGDQLFLSCRWETKHGTVVLQALNDTFGTTFSELIILDGESVLVGLTVPEFSDEAYVAGYELFNPMTGEIIGGASADAAFVPGTRVNDHEWVEGTRFSLAGRELGAVGVLTIETAGGTTVLGMDDSSCDATDLRVKLVEKQ